MGVTLSFLCRQSDCAFYGCNASWVKERGHYHFRCPKCGAEYRPFSMVKQQIVGSHVLQVPDPVSGSPYQILCKWPEHEDELWLWRRAEIAATELETPTDAHAYLSGATAMLSDMIKRVGRIEGFHQYPWDAAVMKDRSVPPEVWDWSHLDEAGFYSGCILDPQFQNDPPFDDWPALIGLVAKTLVGMTAVSRL